MSNTVQFYFDSIERDPNLYLGIEGLNDFEVVTIERALTHADFIQKYGSLDQFLARNENASFEKFRITLKRKNGTSRGILQFKPVQNLTFKATPKTDMINQPTTNTQPETMPTHVEASAPVQNNIGLMASPPMGLMAGLNQVETAYRYMDYTRVTAENKRLETELREAKSLIEKQKEELLEKKYSNEKGQQTNELLIGLSQLAQPFIEKMAVGSSTASLPLAAPVATSAIKQNYFALLEEADDQTVDYIQTVTLLMSENLDFANELSNLVKRFNNGGI